MQRILSDKSVRIANWLVAAVLVLVPFHAFLTVWGSQLVGGYTVLRLWSAVMLAVLVGVVCWWLVKDTALRKWFFGSLLVRLVLAYAALTLVLGVVSWLKGDVSPGAFAYGVLINLRFLAWFLAVLLVVQRSSWLAGNWTKLVLVPAAVVVSFAVLQYTVLPHNFLAHFGYGPGTIEAFETINNNPEYIRVQSTLRGANPLGAYLVVVLSVLGGLFMAGRRRIVCVVFGVAAAFALFASGSRSAWGATAVSLALIVWFRLSTTRARLVFAGVALVLALMAVSGFFALRHHADLQNAVLHTQDNSNISVTSNEAHASALREGLKDVASQPLGAGPGTAGPASVHNQVGGPRIAENYYVQIGQEVGWLGLALFLGIIVLVALELFQARASLLALVLFASFVGLALINFVSHAWTDDTLAFLWWGLAGIALARPLPKTKTMKHEAT